MDVSGSQDGSSTLWARFLRSYERFPRRLAIAVGGNELTYEELSRKALRLAATVQSVSAPSGVPLTAVFAYRSETSYVGVLGALLAGHGYFPLNRTFPAERTRFMLERSTCETLV